MPVLAWAAHRTVRTSEGKHARRILRFRMSLTLTLECPTHPRYTGKIGDNLACAECRLIFAFRNNVHRVLSTPREDRTDVNERVIRSLE